MLHSPIKHLNRNNHCNQLKEYILSLAAFSNGELYTDIYCCNREFQALMEQISW